MEDPEPEAPEQLFIDDDNVQDEFFVTLKRYEREKEDQAFVAKGYTAVWNWVMETVDPGVLALTENELVSEGLVSLQTLVRGLKRFLAPTERSTLAHVRREYRKALEAARHGNIAPEKWYLEWRKAYFRARAYGAPEIMPPMGAEDFLLAVGARMAPAWAQRELQALVGAAEIGEFDRIRSIEEYASIFAAIVRRSDASDNAFTTLGGRPEPPPVVSEKDQSENSAKRPARTPRGTGAYRANCPCGASHKWRPVRCSRLEAAVRGACEYREAPPLTSAEKEAILERLRAAEFANLRIAIREMGWVWVDGDPDEKEEASGTALGDIEC